MGRSFSQTVKRREYPQQNHNMVGGRLGNRPMDPITPRCINRMGNDDGRDREKKERRGEAGVPSEEEDEEDEEEDEEAQVTGKAAKKPTPQENGSDSDDDEDETVSENGKSAGKSGKKPDPKDKRRKPEEIEIDSDDDEENDENARVPKKGKGNEKSGKKAPKNQRQRATKSATKDTRRTPDESDSDSDDDEENDENARVPKKGKGNEKSGKKAPKNKRQRATKWDTKYKRRTPDESDSDSDDDEENDENARVPKKGKGNEKSGKKAPKNKRQRATEATDEVSLDDDGDSSSTNAKKKARKTKKQRDPWYDHLNQVVKELFRIHKLTPTDEVIDDYADAIMDNLGKPEYMETAKMGKQDRKRVRELRKQFRKDHEDIWLSALCDHRSYVQGRLRRACHELLEEKIVTELPDPGIFEKILTRDPGVWNLTEEEKDTRARGESSVQIDEKLKKMNFFRFWFDFYVEKMLPTIAGSDLWNDIKYSEPVSTCLVPGTKKSLRITTSTEAFTVLLYKNCYKKWNKMYRDYEAHRDSGSGTKWRCPRYHKEKFPDEDYKTPYTDATKGRQKEGGFNWQGMEEYNRLQCLVFDSRDAPGGKDRFLRVEKRSLARLDKVRVKPKPKPARLNDNNDGTKRKITRWFVEE